MSADDDAQFMRRTEVDHWEPLARFEITDEHLTNYDPAWGTAIVWLRTELGPQRDDRMIHREKAWGLFHHPGGAERVHTGPGWRGRYPWSTRELHPALPDGFVMPWRRSFGSP